MKQNSHINIKSHLIKKLDSIDECGPKRNCSSFKEIGQAMTGFDPDMFASSNVCTELCEAQALICDDDDFNLMVLEMMLLELNIKCFKFQSGNLAVQCF